MRRFDVEAAITAALPELDRRLRQPSVAVVATRVHTLTAGELEDDATLAAALCRVAASVGRGVTRPEDDGAEALTEQERRRAAAKTEQQHQTEADNRDHALVALSAAANIVERLGEGGADSAWLDTDTLFEYALSLAEAGSERLVRERALALCVATARYLPQFERGLKLGVEALRSVREYAHSPSTAPFVRMQALSLLAEVLAQEIRQELRPALEDIVSRDSMLIRHHALGLLVGARLDAAEKLAMAWELRSDPSEHVRQGLCRTLGRLGAGSEEDSPALERLAELLRDDPSERVQAAALMELSKSTQQDRDALLRLSEALVFAFHASRLLKRAAIAVISERMQAQQSLLVVAALRDAVQSLIDGADMELAEKAALLAREWERHNRADVQQAHTALAEAVADLAEGQSCSYSWPEEESERALERAMCVLGANDFPLSLRIAGRGRGRLVRGERRRSRLWRLGHELSHPAPDKRQNYLHAKARDDRGDLVSVPLLLSEVTATRVPGERRTLLGQSWGGFLPRVDDFLFAAEQRKSRRLLTVFGTIVILPPPSWGGCLRARLAINWSYGALAELREQALQARQKKERRSFVARLQQLGFTLRWNETQVEFGREPLCSRPPHLEQYFALPITLWIEDAIQYVLMPTGNTAWHLAMVVWVLLSVMVLRSAWTLTQFERSRRAIPLSLGGWGSRGKSGTERLKAALFHAQHFDVVSKTTGCEAMIIVARRGQPASEVFLYRPYDKATIWEQERVVEYAQALGAQVFLWECMALQPEFVDILNREWMKDPITTITNAYPDHEDVMGPAGEDVARTIAQFIPKHGTVISSEDQMRPIVRESARRAGSRLVDVGDLEADLLPQDLLDRFPYDEHPRNIALVLRLAEHLELDRIRALVDIADYVFPDLGVLKTYPVVVHRRRQLRFSNGMSANERAGFLSNWRRLGFAEHTADMDPERMIVAVVNNRADRVPRSRVFAELLADDAVFDCIVIIGTNQLGMRGFLEEAVQERIRSTQLADEAGSLVDGVHRAWDDLGAPRQAISVAYRLGALQMALGLQPNVDALALQLSELQANVARPEKLEAVLAGFAKEFCAAMLDQVEGEDWAFDDDAAGDLSRRVGFLVGPWLERCGLASFVDGKAGSVELTQRIRDLYVERFMGKVFVLSDSGAKGDQVIDFIARQLPPGMRYELLGCQNIKGTGLDFVYRFTSIERVHGWLRALEEAPDERARTLAQLDNHADYGLFDAAMALSAVTEKLALPEWEEHRAVMERLRKRFVDLVAKKQENLETKERRSVLATVLGWVEPFVDHLDAILRHRRAVATMRDLIRGRVGQAEAVERLRELTVRQKGGWLAKDVLSVLERGERER